ncbi:MAG: hypothetical protein IM638_13505 [Bacteroidetes bacterium]|nr:hypothetical protein [Bacteroidota bacterium]
MKKLLLAATVCAFAVSCKVTTPVTATSNPVGTKVGTSTARRVFGFWVQSDASIATAAKNGGITKISTVDMTRRNGIIIYKIETRVTGE